MTRRLAALVGLLALTGPAANGQGRLPATGSEVFRFALYRHEVQPLPNPADALDDPQHTMIVVIGDTRPPNQFAGPVDGGQLQRYVRAGGAVLVASDGPAGLRAAAGRGPDWAAFFGVEITGTRLTADPQNSYHRRDGQPFVKPRPRVEWGRPSPFDLFTDAQKDGALPIATLHPREMSVQNGGQFLLKNLAGYVDGTRRAPNGPPVPPALNHFAISLQPQGFRDDPAGRMIVLANRGVLANGMMGVVKDDTDPRGYRFDNGNWAFANRTIDWLQGGPQRPRAGCLFIEDGRVVDRFAIELPPNPQPPVPKIPPDVIANWLLNAANPIVEEAQQRDVFNRFLERSLGFPRLVRIFLVTVTVLFILVCLRRLLRGHRKAEPAATLTPGARDSLLPRGGVLRQRTASQIEVGNLYEAARRRVRERFDVLGGRPGPGGQMPPVLTANDLPDGPLLHQSVRWLWALGYGETPIAVPPADWDRTNVLLERVTARAARGDWSFGQDAG